MTRDEFYAMVEEASNKVLMVVPKGTLASQESTVYIDPWPLWGDAFPASHDPYGRCLECGNAIHQPEIIRYHRDKCDGYAHDACVQGRLRDDRQRELDGHLNRLAG